MTRSTNNLIVFILLNIYMISVKCQNVVSLQNYDLTQSVTKSLEEVSLAKRLQLISKEDRNFLNSFQDILPKSINPMLLEMLPQTASDKCFLDLEYVLDSLLPPAGWALKMVDSYGKPGSGILMGNLNWLGEYDECLKIYAPPKGKTGLGDFLGKYCTLQIPLEIGNMEHFKISIGVCLPSSCNPNVTFDGMFKNLPVNFNLTGLNETLQTIFNNATITCQARVKEYTKGFIVVIFLLSVITFLAVIGSSITALEHCLALKTEKNPANTTDIVTHNADMETASHKSSLTLSADYKVKLPVWLEKCKPFFNSFCIFTNGEKLLNTFSGEGQLPCLHGIRFLSMTWVIACHGYMAAANSAKNPLEIADYVNTFSFQVILNGFFSVDSFFVLSGFLVGYLYFQQVHKTDGKIPWIYFYVHRYIRLTPLYMIVLAFYTTVSPYLGSGPLWPEGTVIKACKNNWWWNILYINNFLTQDSVCIGWSWYLANDMQFYIISPLFLITLYRWPKIGYSLLGLFLCVTFTTTFAITYENNLDAGLGNIGEHANDLQKALPRLTNYFEKINIKPYTRIGAYVIGLLLAYVIYKRKQNNSGKLNTMTLSIGWILASGIALTCQFGLYNQTLSLVAKSFYNALSRIGFSLSLSWVIFVCVIGQGDVVNRILSWKPLIPLSRLTYCAYLIHPIVQTAYFLSIRELLRFNHINVIMLHLGTLFISYFAALIASLLFESPVIRLERLLRNKVSS